MSKTNSFLKSPAATFVHQAGVTKMAAPSTTITCAHAGFENTSAPQIAANTTGLGEISS